MRFASRWRHAGATVNRRPRPRGDRPATPPLRAEVDIASIAAGGEGVGRLPDGRAVFVHRTAPGERVEVQVTQSRPRWSRARLLRVIKASPDRRAAPCPHYAECGGCTLEHLEYAAQLRSKARIVADAFARIGDLPLDPPEVVPSPREHRYRNRVSFALRRLGHGQVAAGFHALHDPDRVVEVDGTCLLPEAPISEAWDALRAAWGTDARRLPSGERLRLTLRATAGGEVSLLVEGGYGEGRPAELLEAVPSLRAIWHRPEGRPARLLAGPPELPETWGEEAFDVGGAAFLQVNRTAAALLEAHVVDVAGDVAGRHVVDAYCGIGLHARRLARLGARVTGIELDADAVQAASSAGLSRSRFIAGRVEDELPALLRSDPAELAILNPPRAGIDTAVIEALVSAPPTRIVYVSCDPATLARDVKRLEGFAVEGVRCFDLFPQTAHVESVAVLALAP